MSDEGGGVPEWVLTYGDMMSLLLCFFILLYSMSGGQKHVPEAVIEAILKQFGDPHSLAMFHLNKRMSAVESPGKSITENRKSTIPRQKANAAQPGRPGHRTRVTEIRDGNRLVIGGPVVFEPGSAQLTDDAREAILDIASSLRGKMHLIEVKGFEPPSLPVGTTQFPDTRSLAYARTMAVADLLINEGKIHRNIVRTSIAAPVEAESLPRAPTGEPLFNRVVIANMESSSTDFLESSLPAPN